MRCTLRQRLWSCTLKSSNVHDAIFVHHRGHGEASPRDLHFEPRESFFEEDIGAKCPASSVQLVISISHTGTHKTVVTRDTSERLLNRVSKFSLAYAFKCRRLEQRRISDRLRQPHVSHPVFLVWIGTTIAACWLLQLLPSALRLGTVVQQGGLGQSSDSCNHAVI